MKNPGIYVLTNKVNGKQYVGRDVNLPNRPNKHLAGKTPSCSAIHRAIKKHGRDVFDISIIPYPFISNEALNAIEIWKITQLNTKTPHGYNLTGGGEGIRGFSHTPETRQRLSEINRGKTHSLETRQKISSGNFGKILSLETRQKMSNSKRGEKNAMYGKTFSPEHRQKISSGNLGKNHSLETRQRLSEINRGKTLSPEHRQKLSDSHLGNKPTLETRLKMSEAHRGQKNHNSLTQNRIDHIQYLFLNGIRPLHVISSIVGVNKNTVRKYTKHLF